MNRRLLTILLCALVVSTAASYVVYRLVGKRIAAKTQPQNQLTHVIVAARNLELGTLIGANDVKVGDWVGTPPAGVAVKTDNVIGRGVVSAIYAGEPISETRLAAAGSGGGLAATIPPGMRACAVRVNDIVGLAGFVLPGMRVDVLISGNPPGANQAAGSKVRTLLQNIQVLSAGANIQKDNEGKPVQVQVVNLLVTPEQAEVLSLASGDQTRIQLVLRNPLDTQVAKTSGSVMAKLFADSNAPDPAAAERPRAVRPKATPPPPAAKPIPPGFYTIEVLNGAKRTEAKFAAEENK
ncbi:MAG TPA: Flp pilus assembly protein CpaB [Bryobacteraceae bacterium]|nr:Flp pilus assembly protein CpaB [Bryobacteraceae bacterium]